MNTEVSKNKVSSEKKKVTYHIKVSNDWSKNFRLIMNTFRGLAVECSREM
jgi:hypothetical protein